MTKFNFKRLRDKKPVGDLRDYLTNWLIDNPEDKVLISTDSQNRGDQTLYARVIVLYKEGKGGHVIYERLKYPRTKYGKQSGLDYEKLEKEAILSFELAEFLIDELNRKPDVIALDYNPDPHYFSNTLLRNSIGWMQTYAKKVVGKPNPYAYVADHAVRK